MPNHVHLLTEMLDDPMSRVMHGLLTGYSQYYNRKYKKRMLGSEEFLDGVKHRIGDYLGKRERRVRKPDLEAILKAAEKATALGRKEFCTNSKSRALVMIKEAIIAIGDENGILTRELADVLGVDPSAVSKRRDGARARAETSGEMMRLRKAIRSGMVRP